MDNTALRGLTCNFGNATLSAGTTKTISIGANIVYCIKGKTYSKTSAANQATPTTDAATGAAFKGVKANQGCVFVLALDASGNTKAVQGEITDLDAAGNFIVAPEFPLMPEDVCPVGYYIIKAGSTANATTGWVLGSSNSASVTGITYTLVNCSVLPDRPQTA